ncbi:MAG: insulinase family protein [Thermoanaerobaculia bacterium]|nr:MAG: insulinase family protein [Thermoanaerobaculia bacterium]MBZ0102785.1 insulinase family protein [Thermoanaerobaculia bacterium]
MNSGHEIAFERHRLDNGLRVLLHPDRRLPLTAVNLWYRVGSKNERPGRTGFAHLFEHMLFQGSEHVGTNDHFRHLQRIGGVANGSTWYDRTNYYETVPAQELDLALWLESDRMGFLLPGLDQKKLDTQRDVVMNERRQRVDNQPYGRPFEHLFELLVPADHPYHWPVIGYMEDIEAATLEEVHAFFRTWYGPANAVLTVAGDFDPAEALARVEHWFGDLPGGPPPIHGSWPLPPLGTAVEETVEDDVRLSRVYMAFRTEPFATDDWFATSLLATLLADGKSSPLYRDLVWERQLAQEVACYLYPTSEIGVLLVVATARPGSEPQALAAALRAHLDRAASGDLLTADHLDRARNKTLAGQWAELETLDHRADQLSMYTSLFDRPDLAGSEPARYAACRAEDLARVAATRLAAHQAVTLTVVPRRSAA